MSLKVSQTSNLKRRYAAQVSVGVAPSPGHMQSMMWGPHWSYLASPCVLAELVERGRLEQGHRPEGHKERKYNLLVDIGHYKDQNYSSATNHTNHVAPLR
ncbi:hypothetical protein PoB_006964100 [Plakobranchus ocellatus]|uniref:Uncharacterized protein n=1 Tax=Plakobranchus ocellatus TaxID=259542 RepID=A0AAV4DG46_9GAST|nr:hypothetical protein PoB_006964100 [Plakobranchus ocellatus]